MAEIIGVVASGISIVQLSGQVAQSLVKLKSYWDEVRDAPDEVKSLVRDMDLLRLILSDFEEERRLSHLPDIVFNNQIFDQSLTFCNEAALELSEVADAMSSQLSSSNCFHRKRGALNVVLKQAHIKRCKSRLKRALSLLSLSHQSYTRAIFRLQLESLSAVQPKVPVLAVQTSDFVDGQTTKSDKFSPPESYVEDRTLHTFEISPANFKNRSGSIINFDAAAALFGSVSISQQRVARGQISRSKVMAQYRVPQWLGYRVWQLCCYRAQVGWSLFLSTHNVVPSNSRQLLYAKFGCLSKLQRMISNNEASIFDETDKGNSILSIAALGGQIDVCRWLLQQGARTDHMRFGSILNQILHYGGSMSFQEGLSTLEIVKLLQNKEEKDILDCYDSTEERCSYYGRKDVLVWLLDQSRFLGYDHAAEDRAQLAINVARNIQHNAPELVKTLLTDIDPQVALRAKNANGVTLLHRIASRIGGAFAYEAQQMEKQTKFLDAGFSLPQDALEKDSIARNGWRSYLRCLNLEGVDIHAVTEFQRASPATPLVMGIRTLIFLWVGSTAKQMTALSDFLQAWLSDLRSLGVDLLLYGQEEKRLQNEGIMSKDFHRRQENDKMGLVEYRETPHRAHGAMRLINFTPSACAKKWLFWWSEPTDEFAGEFWNMSERVPVRTPGAWDEESDL